MEEANPHKKDVEHEEQNAQGRKSNRSKSCVNHPVSGTEIALATPKLVITQVP
jgi:hypothetical protein